MPFEGPVRMKAPNHNFHCILHYTKGTHILLHLFLGTVIAEGQRFINDAFDLKKRHYIGPTSTCAELAFLMSNQVLSRKGALMWDCFAGTGSLLVAATAHGAHCIGTDIDVRVLKGIKKGKKAESVRSNFEQYHLQYPELIRADLSALPLRFTNLYDSFIIELTIELMVFFVTLLMVFVLVLVRHVVNKVNILL